MPGQNYDYVIVGAGSAGCVLAAGLGEDQAVRVALVSSWGDSRLLSCNAARKGASL
jgi:choline dehydrogenase